MVLMHPVCHLLLNGLLLLRFAHERPLLSLCTAQLDNIGGLVAGVRL